ncbi:hypothetical protein NEMIN01_1418 [Nematocida minor]|uniref:uncharacterized protein n=1 Tax=Nematocida minor TaxID=1912983 RepID=UPI00222128F4|nr:uncharacterized protein NEMIN01_1418 [Nematocida minor]KAI5191210.1 hypothetical protein NEMIN01_1418 [Nematocida minor]
MNLWRSFYSLLLIAVAATGSIRADMELAVGGMFPASNTIPVTVYIPPEAYDIYKQQGIEIVSKVNLVFKMVELGINKAMKEIKSERVFSIVPRIRKPSLDPRHRVCPSTLSQMAIFLSRVYDESGGNNSFIFITPCPLLELRKKVRRLRQPDFYISQRINGTHKTMNLVSIEIEPATMISTLSRAILKACDLTDIEPLSVISAMDVSNGLSFGVSIRKETAQEMILKEYS